MNCPECGGKLGVIDSRAVANNSTRRRLECGKCGERFTSIETIIPDGQHSANAECDKCIAGIFSRLANSAVESGYTSTLTGGIYATKEHAVKDSIAELKRIYNEQRKVYAGRVDEKKAMEIEKLLKKARGEE